MTASTKTTKLTPGTLCWLVNADNGRHGDDVVVLSRPRKEKGKLWVNVRSFLDSSEYLTLAINLVPKDSLESVEEINGCRANYEALKVKLAAQKQYWDEYQLAEEMAADIDAQEEARQNAVWAAATPEVIERRPATNEFNKFHGKVRVTGPAYEYRRKGREPQTIQRTLDVSVFGSEVNWSAIGNASPDVARAYAKAILLAADVAEGKA